MNTIEIDRDRLCKSLMDLYSTSRARGNVANLMANAVLRLAQQP